MPLHQACATTGDTRLSVLVVFVAVIRSVAAKVLVGGKGGSM
jgi:hypothetical protein